MVHSANDGADGLLRVGVVGVGVMGSNHARVFTNLPGVQLVGIADPDPYDGVAFGQVDLWTYDHYHASIQGYYLEALVVFGRVTGLDPTRLGANERAADDLGIDPRVAVQLQQIAKAQLALP